MSVSVPPESRLLQTYQEIIDCLIDFAQELIQLIMLSMCAKQPFKMV